VERRKSREVSVRGVKIGGGAPISVQSMLKCDPADVEESLRQIRELVEAGCHVVRLAVPNAAAVEAFAEIRERTDAPLVADIHFSRELALAAIRAGADKVRINPGNIGGAEDVRAVVEAAGERGIPVRIGANSGSILPRGAESAAGREEMVEALVSGLMRDVGTCEEASFRDIVLSVKSPDVAVTVEAYRRVAQRCDYPLHLGVTAAGPADLAVVKNAVGIGSLLLDGIGDTVRVSITGPPAQEVEAAYLILGALRMGEAGPQIISCPTCGRCKVDILPIIRRVRERLKGVRAPVSIAVMGCEVNGPGEARDADVGLALAGERGGTIFRKGEPARRLGVGMGTERMAEELLAEIDALVASGVAGGDRA